MENPLKSRGILPTSPEKLEPCSILLGNNLPICTEATLINKLPKLMDLKP